MSTRTLLLSCALACLPTLVASADAAASVAGQYSLTTSTSIPFPTAALDNTAAQAFIVDGWSLSKGRIQNGASDVAFVDDPFPKSPTPGGAIPGFNEAAPVLEITYPEGMAASTHSGAQMYSLWNTSDGSVFDSMMLQYEIAFDAGFDWIKGGKLPGLRGGPDRLGCSGGNEPNGTDCFSTRLMWRPAGEGEVYAYIQEPGDLCKEANFVCNSDFGISIARGSFTFLPGQWNRITILVQMNEPANSANGYLGLWYNDVQAINQTGLQFRKGDVVDIGGLYFSTFFGGDDPTWAPDNTTHTYFRNLRLWGGSSASTLPPGSGASRLTGTRALVSGLASLVVGAAITVGAGVLGLY